MAATGAIDLSFRADLSNLTKQLAKMPEVTEKEAKEMVKALEKQFKSAEKAAERAAKKTERAFSRAGKGVAKAGDDTAQLSNEMLELGETAGDADTALKGVGGALGLISPEAERVFSTIGELGGGLEGVIRTLKAGVGPIGIVAAAVGAGAFAWKHYSDQLEEAEQKAQDMADAAAEMATSVNAFKADQARIELEHLVATGQEEIEVLRLAQAQDKARAVVREQQERAVTKLTEAQDVYNQAKLNEAAALKGSLDGTISDAKAHAKATKDLAQAEVVLNRRQAAVDALANKEANLAAKIFETSEANAKANKRSSRATKETKDAIDELIESTDRLMPDARSPLQKMRDQLVELEAEAGKSDEAAARLQDTINGLNGAILGSELQEQINQQDAAAEATEKHTEKLKAQTSAFVAQSTETERARSILRELEAASNDTASSTANFKDEIAAVQDKLDKLQTEEAKKQLNDLAQQINAIGGSFAQALSNIGQLQMGEAIKDAKEALAFFDKRAEDIESQIDAINDTISQTTDERVREQLESEKALLEGRLEANAKAKEEEKAIQNQAIADAHRVQQNINLAAIAMNTAPAVMQAWAQLGPIGAPLATAGILDLGATQAGLVSAQEPPTLHWGGMGKPDETMIRARVGEGVLTPQGVQAIGGQEGLNAANMGRGMGGQIVVQQVYKHRVLDTVLTDSIKRGGPISAELNRRQRRGRRNPHRRAS